MHATFQQILNEYYIVWVVAVWYVGSVFGSCATIALLRRGHRSAAKSILIGAGVSYMIFVLALMPSLWSSEVDGTTFVLRTIAGALTASIYLSAVIIRCHGKTKTLPLFTLGALIALVFIYRQTVLPGEVLACSWTVLYGLVVLSLSQIIFVDRHNKLNIDDRAGARRNLRPLAFLTGAKLLTILCYNLPFACIAMQYFHLLAASRHVDASKSFNHLIVFICTRCVLGIFTIFDDVNKHAANASAVVNHLSAAIYLTVLMCVTIVVLLLLLLNERMMNYANEYLVQNGYEYGAGVMVSSAYAILSVYIDSIGHNAIISTTSVFSFGKRSQSLVFASCIEHLIDVVFIVAYLNRLIETRRVLMAICFCGLSVAIEAILQSTTTEHADRFETMQNFFKLEII